MMELLKKLAESNTINFIIMLGILAVIVIKMNLKASMDTSISNVAGIIKKSDDAKSESITKLEKSKAEIEKLPTDIENLKKEAKVKADVFKKQIENSSSEEISNIKNSVSRVMSIEEKKISNDLQKKTVEESILMAEKNIKRMLSENSDLHRQFIQESLDELDKVNL